MFLSYLFLSYLSGLNKNRWIMCYTRLWGFVVGKGSSGSKAIALKRVCGKGSSG